MGDNEIKNKIEIKTSKYKKNFTSLIFKNKTILKLTLITMLISGVCLNCIYGFGLQDAEVHCLEDKTHTMTDSINKYLLENPIVSNFLTIISSFFIDITMISICIYWILFSESWRFLVSLFGFYILRAVTQAFFIMRAPDGLIWNYPGFPSLAVSYLKTTDFFFSGHVGLPIITSCEFSKNGYIFLTYFSLLTCLIEFVVMTVMRGHYIIDLIFGVITSHYVYIIVDKYIYIMDDSPISLKSRNSEINQDKIE